MKVVLEPREGRDGLRELVGRRSREDVIAREEDVVHLQAEEAGAVAGHVDDLVAGPDGVGVAQETVDFLRAECALPGRIHLEEIGPLRVGDAGAPPVDVAVLGRDHEPFGEAGEHARVELVDGEPRARFALENVRAAEVVEVRVADDAPVEVLVSRRLAEHLAHDREAERQVTTRRVEPGAAVEEDGAPCVDEQVDVVDMSWKGLDAHRVDARPALGVEPLNASDSVLFDVHAPVGGPLGLARRIRHDKLVQLSHPQGGPDLSHIVFGGGKLEERPAGV